MKTIVLLSPYWKEPHRWMVSSYKLAELWQRMGYRVIVVCMGSETKVEEVSDTLAVHSRKDFFLKDPWNYGIAFGFAGYARKVIKQEKPDYIIVNKLLFWTSFATIPLRLMGHKVIVMTDALVGMTWWPRGWLPKICAAIYAWTWGWLIMLFANRVVLFHPQAPKLLKRILVAKKTEVIPTGIDPSGYAPSERSGITVTYVGRLESIKGVDDFLAALVPLKRDYPHLKLQIVGWYKPGHPLVSLYGADVDFLGLRDDIPEILGKTDIFVMPSHSEGLSNAIMEAMSSECACVVSEVGGNTFLVQNGVSGFHFPAGDQAALRSHVARLIEDPAKRKALGAAARKRIDEHFSWDIVAKQYEGFFDRV